MSRDRDDSKSMFAEESSLRWAFLEDDPDPCAVVSERMEVVYLNSSARKLVADRWFGRRCFEVLPVVNETCALHCPTIRAVNESDDVVYCEERLRLGDGAERDLGVALIPLGQGRDDCARAVLLLREKGTARDEAEFRSGLLADAGRLRDRIEASPR